jgi:hypothetical protein
MTTIAYIALGLLLVLVVGVLFGFYLLAQEDNHGQS